MRRQLSKRFALKPVPEGVTIKYRHYTDPQDLADMGHPKAKYLTIACLEYEDPNGFGFIFTSASCNPKDTPCRKVGRAIAHNRAISWYERTRKEVTA